MSAMLPVALPPRGAVPNAAARRGRPGGSRPQARLATRCFVSDKRGGKATSSRSRDAAPSLSAWWRLRAAPAAPAGARARSRRERDARLRERGRRGLKRDGAEAFRRWLLERSSRIGRASRSLSSLPLAISEFLAIAGFSALGAVIEQNKGTAWYVQNYPTETPAFGFIDYLILDLASTTSTPSGTSWALLLAGLRETSTACVHAAAPGVARQRGLEVPKQAGRAAEDGEAGVPARARARTTLAERLAARGYQVFVEGEKMYAFKGLIRATGAHRRARRAAPHARRRGVLPGSGDSADR